MTLVVLAPYNLLRFPEGGGHFWVYMQYAQGLRSLGCDVWWLEEGSGDPQAGETLRRRLEAYGFSKRLLLQGEAAAADVLGAADLLLNFNYRLDAPARRRALVDIDPGLLQFWLESDQLTAAPHDVYFTTGERIGEPWVHIHPPVCLELWPFAFDRSASTFTTVSSWWGGEWVDDGHEVYDNNKRAAFLEFAELPSMVPQRLELALLLGPGDEEEKSKLESRGWLVRHSREVSSTPADYQRYVQESRGEFSCVKPSCRRFLNGWISDRSICYLASGKPVVLQDAGPSDYLGSDQGLLRFSTLREAADALAAVDADYEAHCRVARALAERHFDAKRTAETILSTALG